MEKGLPLTLDTMYFSTGVSANAQALISDMKAKLTVIHHSKQRNAKLAHVTI